MQISSHKKKAWTTNEKHLALSIYYKSPNCYKFLRTNLLFNLPSVRTIQSWLKIINFKTGIDTTFSKKLAIKVKTMCKNERACAVIFDEIALKPKLEYNESFDYIEGYEDLGFLGRKNEIANSALVFYVRGLFCNWKVPLCYFTSKGPVKGDILAQLIKEVIEGLRRLQLIPVALVADQGTNNRNAYKILGASKLNPVITINNLKLFTIFDVPHLLKSLRNNFINPKLKFKINGHLICWLDIIKTFEIDRKSKTTRALTKITETHLNPNSFQKMRVKYAAQIFSNSVASAVKSASQLQSIESDTAEETSNFINNIDRIFDSLNSKTFLDPNPNRRPLSKSKPTSFNNIKFGIEYFQSLEVFDENGHKKIIFTVLTDLFGHLQSFNCKYLITSHLNQDPVENLFSVIRNRCGYNPTPSVRQFRISLQYNINIRLQKALDSGNCEEDPRNC
nr:unnamed protein product [Callosobruchus chinensis]